VWDWSERRVAARLHHEFDVLSAAFSPDGSVLATGSVRTAHLWSMPAGLEISRIVDTGVVEAVSFGADGMLLTLNQNGPVLAWPWRHDDVIREAATRLPRDLTPLEWSTYLGVEPYRSTRPVSQTPHFAGDASRASNPSTLPVRAPK
jgi:WD40 repeat protein